MSGQTTVLPITRVTRNPLHVWYAKLWTRVKLRAGSGQQEESR